MAMKRCPVCGEKYSDTYKRCPFCEEEETLRSGNAPKHRGGHRVSQNQGPGFLSPVLIIAIIVMICTLAYLLFGDTISAKLGIGQGGASAPAASISEPVISSGSSAAASAPGSSAASSSAVDVSGLLETLTVSNPDITMKVGDAPVKLTVSGGSGSYTWVSDDDGVASVDENGAITAISAGTANVTVTDGTGKGVCIVRVKGTGTPNTGNSTGTVSLSHTDATIRAGESFTLKVTGASSDVTWNSDNSSVATVSGGKVVGVASGKTNITATVDGKTLSCIVRVK